MSRRILSFFIVLISLSGFAQTDSLYFSVTSYYTGTEFHKTDTVSIMNTKKPLDVYFYKEHFNQFFGLPTKLVLKKYKNQEIIEWSKKDAPKDDMGNWSDSYTYDAQGRLIEYSYSSCVFCSQFPWGYTLSYNEYNNVVEQETYLLSQTVKIKEGRPITNSTPNEQTKECILLTYENNKNIVLLERYNQQGISKKIQLLK